MLDTYHSPTAIYIVMELLEGGDLFDRIVERIRYTEDHARKVLFQIITAVHFLHSKRIVHRYAVTLRAPVATIASYLMLPRCCSDLKPENILLVHANDDTQVPPPRRVSVCRCLLIHRSPPVPSLYRSR